MNRKLTITEANYIRYAKQKLGELLEHPDAITYIRQNPNFDYVMHLIAHRDAFARIEAHTKYHGMFSNTHDIEKVGLALILGKDIAKQIHRKWADHHNIDWDNPDEMILVEKILDYESAHYTKLNSQETAYEYVLSAHKDKLDVIKPVLEELNIWESTNNSRLTKEKYNQIIDSIHDEHILAEVRKSYIYIKNNF